MPFDMNTAYDSVARRFSLYRQLVQGVAAGRIPHLIVRGSPGLGKTWEAEDVLGPHVEARRIAYKRSAGHVTPLALYQALWNARSPSCVLLLDDSDSAFKREEGLNLLKAATDSKEPRRVSWNSTSKLVPCREFTFQGRLIIITNERLDSPRMNPLTDRMTTFDLTLNEDERLARILTILDNAPEFKKNKVELTRWFMLNHFTLGENLTVRTAVKALQLCRLEPNNWVELANATLLPNH